MAPDSPSRIGSYRVLRSLGSGGMGEVLLAYDEALDRRVAIKRIRPGADLQAASLERFRREARLAARLAHPAIVQVHHLLEEDGVEHIVMEFVDGASLYDVLAAEDLPVPEGLRIVHRVVEGLAYAHRHGVLHRDLKTENVLLGRPARSPADAEPEGPAPGSPGDPQRSRRADPLAAQQVKIADFGLARPLDDDDGLTRSGLIMGTTRSMSPEQACGDPTDHRADLFSLGVLCYEVFGGVSPFRGRNNVQTLKRLVFDPHPPLQTHHPHLPPALVRLIDQLLEKHPDDRPRNAEAVLATIKAIRDGVAARGLRPLGSPIDDETAVVLPLERLPTPETGHGSSVEPPNPARAGQVPPGGSLGAPRPAADATQIDPYRTHIPAARPSLPGAEAVVPQRVSDEVGGPASTANLGERRQVTVLCCDLARLSDDVSSLDPERLYSVLPTFQALAREVVGGLGGHLLNALGHRLVIVFGYPVVYEDGARRAVSAGLELVRRVAELDDGDGRLAVRIGLHTGPALSLPTQDGTDLVLGPTLDLATRIGHHAEVDEVVLSATTRRLLGEDALTERVGSLSGSLAGTGDGLEVYRLDRLREATGFVAAPTGSPLLGREEELEQLLSAWRRAVAGVGQVVHVGAEPGFGKTRLVLALRERIRRDGEQILVAQGSAFDPNTPLGPIVPLLRTALGISPGPQTSRGDAETLRQRLAALAPALQSSTPFLAPLLGFGEPQAEVARLGAEARRRRTLDAILDVLAELAAKRPLALVMEDLHWFDPTSLELLDRLQRGIEGTPILLLATFRVPFEPPWPSHTARRLYLGRLDEAVARTLVDRWADEHAVPVALREQIVERADGVPLFLEELTKAVAAGGGDEVPATLADSLTARLDRLGAAKQVAQLAAICGRHLSHELLQAVADGDEGTLRSHLDALVGTSILRRQGLGRRARYAFRHALVRDAAANSLLDEHRALLHRRVGSVLETRFPDLGESRPETLANHWRRGRRPERAAAWFARAGDRARDAFANREAVAFLEAALEALDAASRPQRATTRPEPRLPGFGPPPAEPPPLEAPPARGVAETLGDLLSQTGRQSAARDHYQRLAADAPPTERARLLRKSGHTHARDHELDEALETLARAERLLPPEAERERDTWREWLAIQLERTGLLYFAGQLEDLDRLLPTLEPVAERWASPEQNAALYTSLYASDLRRTRYRPSQRGLEQARAALAAREQIAEVDAIAEARFDFAFALLCHGSVEQALQHFDEILPRVEQLALQPVLEPTLAYRGLALRLLGQVDATEAAARAVLALDEAAESYVGLALANLSWVGWRRGQTDDARDASAAALARWREAAISFPFQWSALLPRLALAVVPPAPLIERLLAPDQQCLPDRTRLALEAARTAEEPGDSSAILDAARADALL